MTDHDQPRRGPQTSGISDAVASAIRDTEQLGTELLKRLGYDQFNATRPPAAGPGVAPLLGNVADPAASVMNALATALGTALTAMSTLVADVSQAISSTPHPPTPRPPGAHPPTTSGPAPPSGQGAGSLVFTNGTRGSTATAVLAVTNDAVSVIPGIRLTCTDLMSSGGDRIARGLLHLPTEPLTLGPGERAELTLQITIPDDQAVGLYSGVLGAEHLPEVQVIVQLRVDA